MRGAYERDHNANNFCHPIRCVGAQQVTIPKLFAHGKITEAKQLEVLVVWTITLITDGQFVSC